MGIIVAAVLAIVTESIIDDMMDEKKERTEQLATLRVGGITRVNKVGGITRVNR